MSKPKILITRAIEDAETLANDIENIGYEPIIAPLISIHYQSDFLLKPAACDGYIFTSRYGVKGLMDADLNKPCFVVGESTALAATTAGFKNIHISLNHAAGLEDLIRKTGIKGQLLYPSADVITRPIHSFEDVHIERFIVYHTELVNDLPAEVYALDWLAGLFFSKRTAAHFCDLVGGQDAPNTIRSKRMICLSSAVASPFLEHTYNTVQIANQPTRQTMLDILESLNDKNF